MMYSRISVWVRSKHQRVQCNNYSDCSNWTYNCPGSLRSNACLISFSLSTVSSSLILIWYRFSLVWTNKETRFRTDKILLSLIFKFLHFRKYLFIPANKKAKKSTVKFNLEGVSKCHKKQICKSPSPFV